MPLVAKNNEAVEVEDSACLYNTTHGIPGRLLESLGSLYSLVLKQTAVSRDSYEGPTHKQTVT